MLCSGRACPDLAVSILRARRPSATATPRSAGRFAMSSARRARSPYPYLLWSTPSWWRRRSGSSASAVRSSTSTSIRAARARDRGRFRGNGAGAGRDRVLAPPGLVALTAAEPRGRGCY
jgi:hypothetical protein